MRKANAVTIYRIPISLWSTVEIQPRSPGFVAQIRSSDRATGNSIVGADDLRDAIVFGGGHRCGLTSA